MKYWKNYNEDMISLVSEIRKHNDLNKFNFIESSFYPHVRDILGVTLSIISCELDGPSLNVLDYGSNLAVWANFINKFDTAQLEVKIYDPFANEQILNAISGYHSIVISPDLNGLIEARYDLAVFGSSAQYDPKFISDWGSRIRINSKYLLFTHTPLSLGEAFVSGQLSGYTGEQYVHGYNELLEQLFKDSFKLIFKSVLPNHLSAVEDRFLAQTIYANLLFKRSCPT